MDYRVAAYDRDRHESGLWRCKRAFELELGSETGSEAKANRYERKVTEDYRRRYLEWVDWCVTVEPGCVTVAECEESVVGYVFVLPERLAMIWDAAVLNEIYVDTDWRGSGLADDLMGTALSVARSQSLPIDRLVLDVDTDNERAVGYYRRHGFEHWGAMLARPLTDDSQ